MYVPQFNQHIKYTMSCRGMISKKFYEVVISTSIIKQTGLIFQHLFLSSKLQRLVIHLSCGYGKQLTRNHTCTGISTHPNLTCRLTFSYLADGQFGAHMQVHIQNDGPVTIQLDSPPDSGISTGQESAGNTDLLRHSRQVGL